MEIFHRSWQKVILANTIGELFDTISNSAQSELSVAASWLGIIAYTFQIYFDFSGYSDMAIGLGKMFGFDFLENFNYPYISTSITDFWRRWHMSLSSWFRDYVYIPLGGNRKGKARQCLNIMIVWFLTGFWHGANWNFMLWGVYFGVILLCEKLFLGKALKRYLHFPAPLCTSFYSHRLGNILLRRLRQAHTELQKYVRRRGTSSHKSPNSVLARTVCSNNSDTCDSFNTASKKALP